MHDYTVQMVHDAHKRLHGVVVKTPLQYNERLSRMYEARIFLKREDMQVVRSYKLRGAYNRIARLSAKERMMGVVCASAGNHAQGVAYSCARLSVRGHVYMPRHTPKQKVERVRSFGGEWITIVLVGDTFDEAYAHARTQSEKEGWIFVHPFDDPYVIAGQGTVALECLRQLGDTPDIVVVPIGGGGLAAGVGSYVAKESPHTLCIGAEPSGAPSMQCALREGAPVAVPLTDVFVDGAAVARVGATSFAIAREHIARVVSVPEGRVCMDMIALYQSDGIIAEPAGALSVAALDTLRDVVRGKTVVCVVSGGNNDMSRYPEVVERASVYQGLKHYFVIEFSQRPGALREFLDRALGPRDDITLFEYVKKSNRERGPALVGIELGDKGDRGALEERMRALGITYTYLDAGSSLRRFLV